MQTKTSKQTKDKCPSKKTLGSMPRDYSEEVWKYLLYLRKNGFEWCQLAHRPSVGKGITWCISQIRLTGVETSMLQLQYQPRGQRSRLLQELGWGNRARSNGQTPKRPTSKCKSIRPLSETPVRLRKGFGEFK